MVDSAADIQPGGPIDSTPAARRRGRRAPRPGRHDRTEHATIDLTGARQAVIDTSPPETHDASAVYSTGRGDVSSYHYERQDTERERLASSPDMQAITPEVRGPGQ